MVIADNLKRRSVLHFGQGASAWRSNCRGVVIEFSLNRSDRSLGDRWDNAGSQALWHWITPLAVNLTNSGRVAKD